jgi:hypothetical protein
VSYSDYLKTPEWNTRRRSKLKQADFRCQLCNAGKCELHVHHRSYESVGDEHPEDLVVLCDACHAKFHGKESTSEASGLPDEPTQMETLARTVLLNLLGPNVCEGWSAERYLEVFQCLSHDFKSSADRLIHKRYLFELMVLVRAISSLSSKETRSHFERIQNHINEMPISKALLTEGDVNKYITELAKYEQKILEKLRREPELF